MSFRRSAFPRGFPWKFPEISGNFRRSAVGGRRSSPVGGRLTSAGGQISLEISGIVFSFERAEGSDFQKNRLEIWVRANTQPSRRTIVHLRAPPAGAAGPRRDEWGERLWCAGWPARGRARRVKTRVQPRSGYNRASEQHAALPLQSACSIRGQTYPTPAAPRRVTRP